jgi:hypothetical protein
MKLVSFIIPALCLLFTTQLFGGQPWAVLCLFALIAQAFTDLRAKALTIIVPSLFWIILFRATGDRELFFPYSMYLAIHVSLLLCSRTFWLGSLGGTLVIATFLAVRFLQNATLRVLAVEFGVAVAILAFALFAYAFSRKYIASHAVVAAVASLIAYACLSI